MYIKTWDQEPLQSKWKGQLTKPSPVNNIIHFFKGGWSSWLDSLHTSKEAPSGQWTVISDEALKMKIGQAQPAPRLKT